MTTATKAKSRTRTKRDRSLEPTCIAIGMRDAYYHYPLVVQKRDIGVLAYKFALTLFDVLYKDKEQDKQFNFLNVADNYKAGYMLGSQQCRDMDCKEHKRALASFNKVEAEDEDGVFLVFSLFKKDIDILVRLKDIKDIDDFNSKMEKGELVWQSR